MEKVNLNKTVSSILAVGIYTTIFFYVIGIILLLIKHEDFTVFNQSTFNNVNDFIQKIFKLEPEPFLYIGTIVLILTPILRVFISVFFFYKNHDKKFFYITLIVSAILVISILMGMILSIKL
ncbi:MAG: DUF1634 domain-containing protein [Melioribacter sp.]|uniref:DUF1634 domain-containing protein n=1 Tax=Rosettibacter primus TaxID=3111523 RepID=UPI00247C2C85|nr:DUF1634 domain-containing protein [Melioribacter sp.]